MPGLVLALLVDALKPEYLRYAPFMRGLAARGATGRLREDFGFVPRAAYFGGLSAGAYGFTNMYAFDPVRSPFGAAAALPSLGPRLERAAGIRAFLQARARGQLPAFAASYATTASIPLRVLPAFDVVEKHAPWEPAAGYPSIFSRLRSRGHSWYTQAWPATGSLRDSSDAGIVEATLAGIESSHRFAFVHLQELDGLGHAFGPGSPEVKDGVVRTDSLIERLVGTLRARHDGVDVLLFGDHGMVPVTRHLDLEPWLTRSTLRVRADYQVFVDSTMARFWCFHRGARLRLEEALSDVPGGHLLSPDEVESHGLSTCDPRNGEAYFLADPGVLLFPNFFQREGKTPGMHGYLPECPDNEGLVVLHTEDGRWASQELGVVRAAEVHSILSYLLELDGADGPLLRSREAAASAPRFTARGSPDAEAAVAAQLSRVVEVVHEVVPDAEAIVLEGSFGRGEGSVRRDDRGNWRPVNDYDVLVVAPGSDPGPLRSREHELATEFGIDFVHFAIDDGAWADLPATMATFDRRYGSCVLAGAPGILERMPAFAPGEIALWDGVQLLFNRIAGLLGATLDVVPHRADPGPPGPVYVRTQVAKALIAVGDWHLLCWRGYDASYRARRERFGWLARGAGLASDDVDAVLRGYAAKLDDPEGSDLPSLSSAADMLLRTLSEAIAAVTGESIRTPRDVARAYLRQQSGDAAAVARDNEYLEPRLRIVAPLREHVSISRRQYVYATLPLVLAARTGVAGPDDAWPYLDAVFRTADMPRDLPAACALSTRAWFAIAL